MCDGSPGVVLFVVSFPTNFVTSSPYFSITNLTVKILTNYHILIRNPLHWPICVLRTCIPHRVKLWRDCPHCIVSFPWSQSPIHGCPPVEQIGVSVWHLHHPLLFLPLKFVWRIYSLFVWVNKFFSTCWTFGHWNASVGGSQGTRARWY